MKPTLQQEEILKTYLSDILKYKETIDEVYDHVLSAVENRAENISFQDAVNQVLNNDFGGGKGLSKFEKQYLKDASRVGFSKLFKYLKENFQFPNILFTSLLFFATFLIVKHFTVSIFQSHYIYPIIIGLYLTIILARKFFVGYFTGDKRKSINDIVIGNISYGFFYIAFMSILILPSKLKIFQFVVIDYPMIISGVLTFYLLYTFAIIKLCINEFQPYRMNKI
ncbi:MAG: hypothetical protein EOP43_06550 [Sphingobacteriaceae bacterium]|nr:MAG: hypothetical protein EOP43_06550 [Sphingobacteriaceae bacterium]